MSIKAFEKDTSSGPVALDIGMVPKTMRKNGHRAREIAQSAKCLLHKHKEMSPIL